MARYIGPKTKIARKFSEPIFGEDKFFERKKQPTNQRSNNRRRSKKSEYAIQLMEKQKVKFIYGMLERQFRFFFERASRSKGITGEVLLQLCESRLDNVVFRLGIAKTRSAARQLVSHRHILLNNNVVNIPSCFLKPGDIVGIRAKSRNLASILESIELNKSTYKWLLWNIPSKEGTFLKIPERDQIPENIKEQLIVELYSK